MNKIIPRTLAHLEKVETIGLLPPDKYVYSFTGTRNLTAGGERQIDWVLQDFCWDAAKFITGACPGVDTYVQRRALELYPGAEHEVIVPGQKVPKVEWIIPTDPRVKVIQLPTSAGTRVRNALLVARAHNVIGFAAYEEKHGKSLYSGTWQTLRMARAAGKIFYTEIIGHL